ncbi:MAG: ribosomal-protein-alanine N-acetyltransferase [Chloroflexi bacterium]|nr:ribosomal-protein-alanine N-acetyltransferase [Chloroflexota bacterium]
MTIAKPLQFRMRPMRQADIAAVLKLEQAIFPTPWSKNSYEFEVERNNASDPWVCVVTNATGQVKIAAYVVPWLLVDEVHIANLAVAPEFRRRGLAKRLLLHVLGRAAQKGAQSARLEVRASNPAAQALYASFGFQVVARRTRYYHDNGEDALLMQLNQLDHLGLIQNTPQSAAR